MTEKNKLNKKTTLFLNEKTMSFYKNVSEINQQKLAWITRKVLDNYVEFCEVYKLSNDGYREIDENLKLMFGNNLKNVIVEKISVEEKIFQNGKQFPE
jgi:hypothetical protein